MLRPVWQKIFRFNWVFGIVLVLLLGIPRFIIVLNANVTGNYKFIASIFVAMCLAPFIFLTRQGRRSIGIKKPQNYSWILYAFIGGALCSAIIYFVFTMFFDHTIDNCFVYISKSYSVSKTGFKDSDRLVYFIIYSITGMTFSPIGEELFYRGIVHGSFAEDVGENRASVADSTAFALTHLAHFGIVYDSGSWRFLLLPSILWVCSMFIASRIFFIGKQKSGSILGAIAAHAAFNLTMMYFIFYHILK